MKSILLNLFSIVLIGTLISCSTKQADPNSTMENAQWPKGVCYEIFIQSFADSNGDGIGDIKGATSKLDYLQDLGIRAVWLMPIMPSPSYHKYDVTDYYDIHPDYGTMDDFREFVDEAHKRNMKVIIDLIINHTSSQHPWFIEASKEENNAYRDYYVWANKDSIADQIAKKEITHDSDNITQWHAVNADAEQEHYYGYFIDGMPDLNFDSPNVKEEIFDISEFWLADVGVDGFRMDAAKHIFPDERMEDNYAWWAEFTAKMRTIKPDVYIVGEVWASSDVVASFAKGLPALFNFDLAGSINQTVLKGQSAASTISGHGWEKVKGQSLIDNFLKSEELYRSVSPEFSYATFLSNHDQNRVMSNLKGDVKKAKLAASILLTLPGSPFIYYGEEIGMLGQKPDENIREPFLWDLAKADELRAKWITPVFSTDNTIVPASVQLSDEQSLYSHYKKMIHLRNSSPELTSGELLAAKVNNKSVLGYKRVNQEGTLLILHNLSKKSQIVELEKDKKYYDMLQNTKAKINDDSIRIPAYTTVVLKQN